MEESRRDIVKQLALAVAGSLITLLLITIWGWISAGGAVRWLGGVDQEQLDKAKAAIESTLEERLAGLRGMSQPQLEEAIAALKEKALTEIEDQKAKIFLELERERKEIERVKAVLEPLPPGTVIASVLEPKLFLSEGREEKWRLADASAIPPGSKYGTLVANASIASIDRLPDLRGVFLRGLNTGRKDGREDPDGDNRKAGDYQGVATKRPNKAFTGVTVESGEHSHGFDGARHYDSGAGGHARAKPKGQRRTTHPAGKHRHNVEITRGGDKETRPANVSVYFYIKIN